MIHLFKKKKFTTNNWKHSCKQKTSAVWNHIVRTCKQDSGRSKAESEGLRLQVWKMWQESWLAKEAVWGGGVRSWSPGSSPAALFCSQLRAKKQKTTAECFNLVAIFHNLMILKKIHTHYLGDFPSGWGPALSMHGAWVWCLVEELRSPWQTNYLFSCFGINPVGG